jgi:hypothetical protein
MFIEILSALLPKQDLDVLLGRWVFNGGNLLRFTCRMVVGMGSPLLVPFTGYIGQQ